MPAKDATFSAAQLDGVEHQGPKKLDAKHLLENKPNGTITSVVDIIDIRCEALEVDLKTEIVSMLNPAAGPKQLPTLLLYDEQGLQLFEQITYLEEYYLTNAEIDVLARSAAEMAHHIQPGTMVVELGSGNLRKVSILLEALEAAGTDVDYYALDLSLTELRRTLAAVPDFRHVHCHGLHGTYDDGLAWLQSGPVAARPKCILSLGSSIGNFGRDEAALFLKGFADILRSCDSMLVGVDACADPGKVYHAYNDREGITHEFILNGLQHANGILNEQAFHVGDWSVIGEYVFDVHGGRHQAFYAPKKDVTCLGVTFRQGERVQVEQSLKYSAEESRALFSAAGLKEIGKWRAEKVDYNVHLLKKLRMPFPSSPSEYARSAVPSVEDWRALWAIWDTVTRGMIPPAALLTRPIELRNPCIFYLGHIPTFLDLQLAKVTSLPLCEPAASAAYARIFERGIDPDVDDPEHCHDHSELPDQWPLLADILEYQDRVRAKVEALCEDVVPRSIGRALWIGFEHEAMHLETLLYMLLQSDDMLPPPRVPRPDFAREAEEAAAASVPNEWYKIPEQEIVVGMDDPEDKDEGDGHFGWDNEKPAHKVKVLAFEAKARPITNEEYIRYLTATDSTVLPATWIRTPLQSNGHTVANTLLTNGHLSNGHQTNGHQTNSHHYNDSHLDPSTLAIRTPYGPVPLQYCLHWPLAASYDELAPCAVWLGGRIPTADETRSLYAYADGLRRRNNKKEAEGVLGGMVPAVNGELGLDGVRESPPSSSGSGGEGGEGRAEGRDKDEEALFTDLTGANIGFTSWTPSPITSSPHLRGRADLGGAWEWTSTVLEPHAGFTPMAAYPGYTSDFFDGKHNVVLGGSWATHPRLAGRRAFVNWYQRNYRFVWAGGRVVRDL